MRGLRIADWGLRIGNAKGAKLLFLMGALIGMFAGCTGCTVVCQNRVFPKLAWYWSDDAKREREYSRQHREAEEAYRKSQLTNNFK